MLLVNSHILKMTAMLKPSAKYNRRTYHQRLSRWALSNENNSILWILEINHLWRYGKIYGFSSTKALVCQRKSYSKEHTPLKGLISDDPEQSLRKISIVGVSEPTMRRIAEEDLRYKSHILKIWQMLSEAARTSRVVRLGSYSGLPTVQI